MQERVYKTLVRDTNDLKLHLIGWKGTIFRVHVFPGSAETLARMGGIANHHLIAYFLSNISAKNYENRLMCVGCYTSVSSFLRHSVETHCAEIVPDWHDNRPLRNSPTAFELPVTHKFDKFNIVNVTYCNAHAIKLSVDWAVHHYTEYFLSIRSVSDYRQELSRRCDTLTWRDVSSYLFTYLPLNYNTLVLP